eukprot:scaffold385_cov305-Pinguiococcus_pyrenoidosus.AAC.55
MPHQMRHHIREVIWDQLVDLRTESRNTHTGDMPPRRSSEIHGTETPSNLDESFRSVQKGFFS